jgi:hypothetical protein
VAVAGLNMPRQEIFGVDSFQCLMLALRLVRTLMQHGADDGGCFLSTRGGEELSIEDLFGTGVLGRI